MITTKYSPILSNEDRDAQFNIEGDNQMPALQWYQITH